MKVKVTPLQLLIMQALLNLLQSSNTILATKYHDALFIGLLACFASTLSMVVQHLGNKADPKGDDE